MFVIMQSGFFRLHVKGERQLQTIRELEAGEDALDEEGLAADDKTDDELSDEDETDFNAVKDGAEVAGEVTDIRLRGHLGWPSVAWQGVKEQLLFIVSRQVFARIDTGEHTS
jgi:hypothetical protein